MRKTFYDTFLFGILAGVVVQLISFYFILLLHKSLLGYTERSVVEFLQYLLNYDTGRTQIIPKLLSLSAISDLLLFFIFIWTNKLRSARGAIGSAFLLGIVIVILKFI
jgi:uncharacterized membrane protein SpoIIM required for sporulation